MHTERFRSLRKKALEGLLAKHSVSKIWRKVVKDQLRSAEIKDLYDNYDFNYNIEDRAAALRALILEGTYKVSTPLIYRSEKKYGVCRHLVIPQPVDALLLQVLAESVAEVILKKQPSDNSFYSRDKGNINKPHEAIDEYGGSFREQWKRLQKQIYKFNDEKDLLIITDLSNYYDSIHLDELRKVFAALAETNEVVVDLLFKVIEGISWIPDYLPYSNRGLPTANIEGIRLLAHCFLFEIDAVIKNKTNNSFTRWMDDLTIGVDDKKKAIALISSISDMLKSRGLALNLSKTEILNSDAAHHHFQIDQNKYLDSIECCAGLSSELKAIEKELMTSFRRHFKDQSARYWAKVTKRYITAFTRLNSQKLVKKLPDLYLYYPTLRPNLLYYLTGIGYLPSSASVLSDILERIDLFDDLSLFQITNLLTSWKFPRTLNGLSWISRFDQLISRRGFEKNDPINFFSLARFKSKYSSSEDLLDFLLKYQNLWQNNSFLRRQGTICICRTLCIPNNKSIELLSHQALSGVPSTVSIVNQIYLFSNIEEVEPKVLMYLFPKNAPKIYPHTKFMVLCSLLNSEKMRANENFCNKIKNFIDDPTHKHWLRVSYGIKI